MGGEVRKENWWMDICRDDMSILEKIIGVVILITLTFTIEYIQTGG